MMTRRDMGYWVIWGLLLGLMLAVLATAVCAQVGIGPGGPQPSNILENYRVGYAGGEPAVGGGADFNDGTAFEFNDGTEMQFN